MINACVIGHGQRGEGLLRDVLLRIEKINVVSVCDKYEDRRDAAVSAVEKAVPIGKRRLTSRA